MVQACEWFGYLLVVDQLFCATSKREITTFPTFEYDVLSMGFCVAGDGNHHPRLFAILQDALDRVTFLAYADS